jgi:uncharacterized surface anchored protein
VDAEGNVSEVPVLEWVSTEEDFYFERLSQGDYILREHTAPAGYVVAEDVPFTVGDTTEVQSVTMSDEATPTPEKLDQTGREGSLPFAVLGVLALLALGGALFVVRQLRIRKGNPDEDGTEE